MFLIHSRRKAFNLAGAMCAIATLCGISSAYGATHILHDTSFRKLVTRVKSSQAPAFTADDDQFNEKDSDWRGRRFDFDWLPMLNLIARLLGYALLIGIPLCPAFESDPMYLLAWLYLSLFHTSFLLDMFLFPTFQMRVSTIMSGPSSSSPPSSSSSSSSPPSSVLPRHVPNITVLC